MDEQDIRALLNRYRPAGPPPELRLHSRRTVSTDRVWPWAAAAGMLLAATVAIHFATASALSRIAPPPADPTSALVEAMGGDEGAQRAARLIVTEQLLTSGGMRRDMSSVVEEPTNAPR